MCVPKAPYSREHLDRAHARAHVRALAGSFTEVVSPSSSLGDGSGHGSAGAGANADARLSFVSRLVIAQGLARRTV